MSITKLKKRTGILFGIFAIVSIFIMSSVAIQQSVNQVGEKAKDMVKPIVTVEVEQEFSRKSGYGTEKVKIDNNLLEKIRNSQYVKQATANASSSAKTNIKHFGEEGKLPSNMGGSDYVISTNRVFSIDSDKLSKDFSEGKVTLTQGEYPKKNNEILISEDLAQLNNLKIGDTVIIDKATSYAPKDDPNNEVSTIITGIFSVDEKANKKFVNQGDFDKRNNIYGTSDFVMDINKFQFKGSSVEPELDNIKVELNDPMDTEKFIQEMESDGSNYASVAFTSSYNQYLLNKKTVDSIAGISKMVLIISLLTAIIILVLVMLLSLRERRYEIGLLLALGESKLGVLLQMIVEVIGVAILGIVVAILLSSTIVTSQITQYINKQMATTESMSQNESYLGKGPMYEEDTDKKSEKIKTVDPATITLENMMLTTFAIFLIVILSTSIPVLLLLRKDPKYILLKSE